jgi:6-phosphofructokinase
MPIPQDSSKNAIIKVIFFNLNQLGINIVQTHPTKIVKAIEVMGRVDEQGHLTLDAPLALEKQTRVKVIVLIPEAVNENNDTSMVKSKVKESEVFQAFLASEEKYSEVYSRLAES